MINHYMSLETVSYEGAAKRVLEATNKAYPLLPCSILKRLWELKSHIHG